MILCVRFLDGAPPAAALGVIEGISPVTQVPAPDSVLVDVAGARRYFGIDAVGLAAVIRVRVLAYAGAECAVGVAANPMLARLAARDAAPGTTVAVADDAREVSAFLAPRPVAALPGVGAATARTLRSYGLDTVGKTADVPLATLQRILGMRQGRELYEKARGVDRTKVVPHAGASSLAAERAFPRDELDQDEQRRALLSCAQELGTRLRDSHRACRSLTLTVRYADGSTTTRTRALREPTAHTADLTEAAYRAHGALGLQRARVRTVSLRADDLVPAERATHQLSLDPADERARRIEEVTDRARAKFGPGAILPGTLVTLTRAT